MSESVISLARCRTLEPTFWELPLVVTISAQDIGRDFSRNDINNADTERLEFRAQGIAIMMKRCLAGIIAGWVGFKSQ
ncbi:thioesterase domain protein [Aspergillus luchuensis]|uniref:Thioesterase domain protein n=1 Tax=Aspergillus kawachii TaxID=1069201 RepID=A0A146FG49_ASPKA|nr:thioesterase domain protein [Aspergillus luchuensis]